MQIETYPEPAQLEAYAKEPMPFHQIKASDLELNEENYLIAEIGNVTYEYKPTQILVETSMGEWENVEDVSYYDIDHEEALNLAIDFQIEEDFICITEFTESLEDEVAQFDAYWVLERVVIERPN